MRYILEAFAPGPLETIYEFEVHVPMFVPPPAPPREPATDEVRDEEREREEAT